MATVNDLKAAFVRGLGLDPDSIDWEGLEYRGITEWDSVAHMALVAELEDSFDVMFDVDDVIAMSSFSAARELLVKHGIDIH